MNNTALSFHSFPKISKENMVLLLKMQNLLFFFFFIFFFLAFAGFLNAQNDGFISIDCGILQGSSYTDDLTGIVYISDADFIDSGENKEIQVELKDFPLPRQFYNVRSFPEGDRNCYTLRPVVKGSKYLVRGSFMYGNYDGKDEIPKFDLYVGVNLWKPINQASASRSDWTEIILMATADFIPVCLVRKTGNPYISALELRPMYSTMYNATDYETTALVLHGRYDVGSATDRIIRYREDVYDRIWAPIYMNNWATLSTSSPVKNEYKDFLPSSVVMNTAVAPANGGNVLFFNWTASSSDEQYVVYRHFSEFSKLKVGELREFDICLVGYPPNYCLTQFQPVYLVADTVFSVTPFSGRIEYACSFTKTNASTLPPILNAIEIYIVTDLSKTATNMKDVDAIMNLKSTYQLKRNWMGDPCIPQNYSWEGINCSYQGPDPPTIVSLNLSSSELDGSIALSIQNLTFLKSLDLSGNNLTGEVPSFLGTLQSLKFMNLSGNQLNGSVPPALLQRMKSGSLQLSIDNNPQLCMSDPCNNSDSCTTNPCELKKKKKKARKIIAPVVIVVSLVTVALLVIAFIYWCMHGNRKSQAATSVSIVNEVGDSFNLENRRFTFAEIVTITNNFQRILGKGGFGIVYHGQMNEGTQVAVKMLSQTSQGSNEFRIEAQMLTRVYHRNLVQFIGYCAEGNKMALVLEYMSEGNLTRVLLESNQNPLNWGQRLQIALDIAQGLEYLHTGCKPPIIHRDVKGTNILLNEKLEAKIADFGLSKVFHDDDFTHVSTVVKGTRGYLDPEYCTTNNLNEKSDVYSFGIVLMELITGKPAIIQTSNSERIHIIDWTRPLLSRGDIGNVVDKRLLGIYDTNSALKVIEIAIACTSHKSTQRPTMSNVVAELKACMGVQRVVSESVSFTSDEYSLTQDTNNSIIGPTSR